MESICFEVNPYDPCVVNSLVDGHQHASGWHVEDLKSSHANPKINDELHKGLQEKCSDSSIIDVKAVCGKMHNYLGMLLEYSTPGGVVKIDVTEFVGDMIEEFPDEELNAQNLTAMEPGPYSPWILKGQASPMMQLLFFIPEHNTMINIDYLYCFKSYNVACKASVLV